MLVEQVYIVMVDCYVGEKSFRPVPLILIHGIRKNGSSHLRLKKISAISTKSVGRYLAYTYQGN